MNRLYPYSLLVVLLVALVFAAEGAILWVRTEHGPTTRNWINPESRIPGKGYMWTWGVEGNPRTEPDEWHFHVMFAANESADIILFWKLNESVLYERRSAQIDESFDVPLPRTNELWRWDWLIRNPHDSVLDVKNFTVVHYSIKYPERQIGILVLGSGVIASLAVPIAIAYQRHRDMRPRSRNSPQSP
jgi:hypothetical protein